MAVPKRRISHSRQGMRRSHQHLHPAQISFCPDCQHQMLPHCVCPNCGFYRKREVVPPKKKEKKQ